MDGEELTAQETALYDRQIRVWGVDAQRRYGLSFHLNWFETMTFTYVKRTSHFPSIPYEYKLIKLFVDAEGPFVCKELNS